MLLTLRYHESGQRPPCAAFLRGTDPAAWLREMSRWGIAASQLSCYLVPESIRTVRPTGLFVVVTGGTLPADVLEPYGVVAGRLYVPVQATLWPATTAEELASALLWPRQVLHPSIGMVGFDTADELDLAALLDCGEPRPTDWSRARPGLPPKPRLQQVRVLTPTTQEIVEAIRQDVGSVPLAQLPGQAEAQSAGPVQRAIDSLRRGLLKMMLGILRCRPQPLSQHTTTILRLLGIGVLLLGAVAMFAYLASGLGTNFLGTGVAVLIMVVARLLRGFLDRDNASDSGHRAASAGRSADSQRPQRPARFQRLERWLDTRIQNLEQKRQNEIERLLRLFQDNPEEALKYAIPLGGPYQDRGQAPASARLGFRLPDFNLGGLGGGGRADVWDLGAYQYTLRQQYQAAARQEAAAGRHKKAAYIHAHLLGDFHSAANALDQGGFYREAAALYKDHLKNLPAAARCLENGGLLLEAADLYAELNQHEKAGDLHTQLAQPEVAARHYERSVELFLGNEDYPEAARLLAYKLTDASRAQDVLLQGWDAAKQPEVCLKQYFDVVAAGPGADLSAHVRDIFRHRTPAGRQVPLLKVLAAVNEKHPAPALRAASLDIAYEVVSAEASVGNVAHLPLLRNFLPDDRLIAADTSRYVSRQPRPATARRPSTSVVVPPLDTTIQWQRAISHGQQWVAIGTRDDRLHLARGNWYGNVEHYSWMTPATGAQVLLVANELYSSRILLRCSMPLPLEAKFLPRNKYFPDALTVECLSWLPPWPVRVCLLPEGKVAAAELVNESTVSVQRFEANGRQLAPVFYDLKKIEPAFAGTERSWPCELIYQDGTYYTYWDNWLVKLATDDTAHLYNAEYGVFQLLKSMYAPYVQLAIATGSGFRLWNSLPVNGSVLGTHIESESVANRDMQFVGPEHLVVLSGHVSYIEEFEEQVVLCHLTLTGCRELRTIDTESPAVAVLPTNERNQFALLEQTGRISLHQIE